MIYIFRYTLFLFILNIQLFAVETINTSDCGSVITSIMPSGDRTHASNTNRSSVIAFDYAQRGLTLILPSPIQLASASEVGTVWGKAYNPNTKKLYVASFLRRHADLSPDGLGAIYEIDLNDISSSATVGSPQLWMNLNSITHLGFGATLFPSETASNRELGTPFTPSHDVWAFSRVAKQGLGGLDISDDGSTLYVMDLTNRQVLAIDIANKHVTHRYAVNNPGCQESNDIRPFAVDYMKGALYIGVNCSGETNKSEDDIRGYVMKLSGNTFQTVLSDVKGYKWPYWWDNDTSQYWEYVPIITNIEIDENNNMIVGVSSVNNWRYASNNYFPYSNDMLTLHESIGYLLHAVPNGSNWTSVAYDSDERQNSFFKNGQFVHWGPGATNTFLGGMALTNCSGKETLLANLMDPLAQETGGTRYILTEDGRQEAATNSNDIDLITSMASTREFYAGVGVSWEKSAGIGDIEYLPLEKVQEPIPCQSSAFMLHTPTLDAPAELSTLDLKSGTLNDITIDLGSTHLNGAGYNKKDGFIWAVDQESKDGTLVRIGLDNNGQYVSQKFKIAGESFSSYIGDVDNNGHLYIKTSSKTGKTGIVIDLDPNSNTYLTKIKPFNLSQTLDIHDWAFNPIDGFLYAVTKSGNTYNSSNPNKLYKINPSNGTVTPLGDTGMNEDGNLGGAFFDKYGIFYVSVNKSRKIYKIDVANSSTASYFSTVNKTLKRNDGAMCSSATVEEPLKDFGDAPNAYAHVSHIISDDLFLGWDSAPDAENDQQSSPHATGDGEDENGSIMFGKLPPLEVGANYYNVLTLPTNTSGKPAYLTAWIDFNRNGVFEYSEAINTENVLVESSDSNKRVNITWDNTTDANTKAIENATEGKAIMRIRLSTEPIPRNNSGLMVSPDGEVEDHEITIVKEKPATTPFTCNNQGIILSAQYKTAPRANASFVDLENQTYGFIKEFGTRQINSIGYNVKDNFIYGIGFNNDSHKTMDVVKIDKDYNVENIHVTGLPQGSSMYALGDVDFNNKLYVSSIHDEDNTSSYDYLKRLIVINLKTKTVERTTDLVFPADSNMTNIKSADYAFNPKDDMLYTVDSNINELVRINPISGEVELLGDIGDINGSYSVISFFDLDGNFLFTDDYNKNIYRINISNPDDINTTAMLYISDLDMPSSGDGAKCAYSRLPALVADYHFDECIWDGTADEVKDSSGNNHHGVAVNTQPKTEMINNSADFIESSNNDYISLDHQAINGIKDFTISTWIKTSNSNSQSLLSGANASQDNELLFWIRGTKFYPHIKGYNKGLAIPNIANNQWHMLTWTRELSENCIYVDGNLAQCRTGFPTGALSIDSGGLILGQEQDRVGGRFDRRQDFEGQIDELLIWNHVSSAQEIQEIYNNQVALKNWDGTARDRVVCQNLMPTIYISDEEILEGNSSTKNLEFTVSLDKPAGAGVSFRFQVFDGNDSNEIINATSPSDYIRENFSTKVVLEGSAQSFTLSIPIKGDTILENDEKFQVVLTEIKRAEIGKATAIGTIINDDFDPCDPRSKNIDTDEDNITDMCDDDDDNDGILDVMEMSCQAPLIDFTHHINSVDGTTQPSGYNNDLTVSYSTSGDPFASVQGFEEDFILLKLIESGPNEKVGMVTKKFNFPIYNLNIDLSDIDYISETRWERAKLIAYYKGAEVAPASIDKGVNLRLNEGYFRGTNETDDYHDLSLSGVIYHYSSPVDEIKIIHSMLDKHGTGTDWNVGSHMSGCIPFDHDTDTFYDHLDLDSDNDGIPDNIEAQTTQGYIKPNKLFDAKGVDTAYSGGLTPVNTDGIDELDYLDLDTDNDGISDIQESGLGNNDNDDDNRTNANVGKNGLDNGATFESADDYKDPNGLAYESDVFHLKDSDNDIPFTGTGAVPLSMDFDYRDRDATTLTIDDIESREGDSGVTTFTLHAILSQPTVRESTMELTLHDGNNTNNMFNAMLTDNDYINDSKTIDIPIASTDFEITLSIINGDHKLEKDEKFIATFNGFTGISLNPINTMITILNDDIINLNIERTNSLIEYKSDGNIEKKHALYTQISKKPFEYAIVVYDRNSSYTKEKAISQFSVKVELIDTTDNDDTTKVLHTTIATFRTSDKGRIKILLDNSVDNIRATKNATYRLSYPIDANDTVIPNSCTTQDCLENVDGFNRFVEVYAKDTFAIRPAGFKLDLKGENDSPLHNNTDTNKIFLTAGYKYSLEATAISYANTINNRYAPQKYEMVNGQQRLTLKQDLNSTLAFKLNPTNCADSSNKTFNYYEFENGINKKQLFFNENVGKYKFTMLDPDWTKIDHPKNAMVKGCIENSNSNVANNSGKYGCDIATSFNSLNETYHDMDVDFQPYSFDVNLNVKSRLNSGHNDFIYMSNLSNNMAILIDGNITAKSKDGNTTTNFTQNCFANSVDLYFDYSVITDGGEFNNSNPVNIRTVEGTPVNTQRKIKHNSDNYGNIQNNSFGENITLNKNDFQDNNKGSSYLNILYNIEKSLNEAINPIEIEFKTAHVESNNSASHLADNLIKDFIPKGEKTLNNKKILYFARIASDLENYPLTYEDSKLTPLNVEIFCDGNISLCQNIIGNNGLYTTRNGWYTSRNHNSAVDGGVGAFNPTNAQNITVVPFIHGRISNLQTVKIGTGDIDTRVEIIPNEPWLLYHPTEASGRPFWTNHFRTTQPSRWSGLGKTGNVIGAEANERPANRMDW